MSNLLFSRLRLPTLLLAAIVSCLSADRAAGGVLSSLEPTQVVPSTVAQPQDVPPGPLNVPGTPYPFTNPGGATIIIESYAASAQPAPVAGNDKAFDITNVFAGDVLFLLDPAGGNDPSNWAAVLRFLNLNDPTGADGLPADELEGFDATNVGPGGFASFHLFPNTIYLADTPISPGDHFATAVEFGPDSGIPAGQVAIFGYEVNVTDSGGTGPGSVPEPSISAALLCGGGLLALATRRRVVSRS